MVCWKCKSEMPEGLKYCGNCGVHMNRAVWFVQWLFSKKGLPVPNAAPICMGMAIPAGPGRAAAVRQRFPTTGTRSGAPSPGRMQTFRIGTEPVSTTPTWTASWSSSGPNMEAQDSSTVIGRWVPARILMPHTK